MKVSEAIREVMSLQGVGTNKMADWLNRPPRLVSDRLRQDNISVAKMDEMLRVLDYKIVIVPREARVPEGGFEIGRDEGSGENEQRTGIKCSNRENACSDARTMSISERLLEEVRDLSEQQQRQLLDFALFLKMRKEKALDSMMDDIISENLLAFEKLAK